MSSQVFTSVYRANLSSSIFRQRTCRSSINFRGSRQCLQSPIMSRRALSLTSHATRSRALTKHLSASRAVSTTSAKPKPVVVPAADILPPEPVSTTVAALESAVDRKRLWPDWTPPTKGVLSKLPSSWVPYAELMRIEKPGGLYGFYFPYLIGLSYAACIAPEISPAFLASTAGTLLVWNIFLRGAACTINDNLDREYDRKVARCRTRPIARGAVTPLQGHIWYAAQTVVGIAAISQLPNAWNCFLHAIPIQFLVSVYPLGKRITDYPQVILSVPLAWAVVMASASLGVDPFTVGSAAVAGATSTLVLSHAIWIVVFDYVNACQDTLDDIKAGVRSMAVRYQNTETFIGVLGSAQVACLVATGIMAGFGPLYFIGACGGNAALLLAMAMTAKRSKPRNCAWWFSYGSMLLGGTTVLGLLAEYVAKIMREEREAEQAMTSSFDDKQALTTEVVAL